VLLLAGGIGITPLRSLFASLPPADGTITLIYRAGADDEVLFHNELKAVARCRGKEFTLLVGHRRELGYDPLALRRLSPLVPDLSGCDIYLCGPREMARDMSKDLRDANFDRRHLFTESFGL
jgi:ferredoxin-NADP reductase